jgi:GNAT superfamily N-acetyltransferase
LNQHSNRIRIERLPEDPPIPVEETIHSLQSIPDFVDLRIWAAWDPAGSEIVAQGNVSLLRTLENRHLVQFDLSVLPCYRRKGLGSSLLRLLIQAAKADQRRMLMAETTDRIPAGQAFMLRIGAQAGLVSHINQLRMTELDSQRVAEWNARGSEQSQAFELGFWEGPYPEGQIQAIAGLFDLTNQQPFGTLWIEPMSISPQQLRSMEANLFAAGYQRWTCYLLSRADHAFAGYTETVWNPHRPEILNQEMTGIFPQYRGRGLGRWIKAAMLEKVRKERPEVKYIRTGNADSNTPMLKINQELGFQPYQATTLWQIELPRLEEFLRFPGVHPDQP